MACPDAPLRLSAQRALLGAVGPDVLGVCVALEDGRLSFDGFMAESATDDEREALDMAATEMLADFPEATALDLKIEPVADTRLPHCDGDWVFLRLGAGVDAPVGS
jgi:hypothetical protein